MYEWKPFSRKQLDAIFNADAFINILEGSVRSGKTIAANVSWINHVLSSPHNRFLMSGESTDSLYRNVIEDIIKIIGEQKVKYQKTAKGGPQLILKVGNKEKICYCRGADKVNSEGAIRGMTTGGWYADEITLHHENFVKQAINRMSLSGAIALWTTNPDNPNHKIKKDYIDQAAIKNYKVWHFELDDNLTLSEVYKKNLKEAYSGVWYKRFILGLWVMAQGAIYDMFNEEKHVVAKIPERFQRRYVACDYGTGNPTAFEAMGDIGPDTYVIKDYHYSGRETGKQKTDSQYRQDLEKFYQAVGFNKSKDEVIVDPSAASFITELKQHGFNVNPAKNDVLDGIRTVANKLDKNHIKIHESCKETIKEFYAYAWDDKAALRGEDKPIKDNDHHMDALRYGIFTKPRQITAGNSLWR